MLLFPNTLPEFLAFMKFTSQQLNNEILKINTDSFKKLVIAINITASYPSIAQLAERLTVRETLLGNP